MPNDENLNDMVPQEPIGTDVPQPPMDTDAAQEPINTEISQEPMMETLDMPNEPMEAQPVPEQPGPAIMPEPAPKQKKQSKLVVWIAVAIIVIGLGVFGYFYFINRNKQMILGKSAIKLQDSLLKRANINFSLPELKEYIETGTMSLELKSDAPEMSDTLNIFNNLNIDYHVENSNKLMFGNFDLKRNDDSIMDIQLEASNNQVHLFAEKLFNKVLLMELNTEFLFEEDAITFDDIDYLFNFVVERTIRNMNSSAFKSEKATIKLEGKEVKTTKTSVLLDQEEVHALTVKVLADLKKDNESIKILEKLSIDIKDFELEDDAEFTGEGNVTYTVYTRGLFNSVVGIDLHIYEKSHISGEYEEYEQDYYDTIDTTVEFRVEKNPVIYVRTSDESYVKFVFNYGTNSVDIRGVDDENTEMLKISIKNPNDKALNIEAEFNDKEAEMILKFGLDLNMKEIVRNKEYESSIKIMIDMSMANNLIFGGELTMNGTTKEFTDSGERRTIDKTNVVKFENITESEMENITMNAMKIFMPELFEQMQLMAICAQVTECGECRRNQCPCTYTDERGRPQEVMCPDLGN